jgi:hypothetical protein
MFDSFKPAGAEAIIVKPVETPNARGRFVSRFWRVLSLALPVAAAAQQPGSAGEKRPKLEVLQSLPEAQLFSLMNLVATSLGVRCDYCHVQANPDLSRTPSNGGGWVWDRDDKLPKRRAREMMKMVRTPSPTPLPSADRVWAAYVSAVGEASTAAPGTGMTIRGWDDRPEGRYGKFEITVAGAHRYRITLTGPELTLNQGLYGEVAWGVTNTGVQPISSPADVARMRRIAMRYRPVKAQPPDVRTVGLERLDDHDAYVLQGRIDSVTTQRSYFDVVTGLLRREITTTETLLLPLEEQVDYDDYRDVGGVRMPFSVRISDGAPYSTTTRTILEIRRNVPVADALFRPPSAPR